MLSCLLHKQPRHVGINENQPVPFIFFLLSFSIGIPSNDSHSTCWVFCSASQACLISSLTQEVKLANEPFSPSLRRVAWKIVGRFEWNYAEADRPSMTSDHVPSQGGETGRLLPRWPGFWKGRECWTATKWEYHEGIRCQEAADPREDSSYWHWKLACRNYVETWIF